MLGPEATIEALLRSTERLLTRGYGTRLQAILREGDLALAQKLVNLGGLDRTFTEARAIQYREQIALVTDYTTRRLAGLSQEQALQAVQTGYRDTVAVMRTFEREFEGISRQLDIEGAARRDFVFARSRTSLLRANRSSWNRYGRAMVNDFERVLRLGMITGATNGELINGLVAQAPPGLAEYLNRREPTWFPDPKAGFVQRKYWAERIVRTEKANAYNEANFSTITEASAQFPDMGKKILAVGDRRTAMDSIYVHGQIRGRDEPFVDGAGRVYQRPPARPNDRETVIPWRAEWKERDSTRAYTEAEREEMLARDRSTDNRTKLPEKARKTDRKPEPLRAKLSNSKEEKQRRTEARRKAAEEARRKAAEEARRSQDRGTAKESLARLEEAAKAVAKHGDSKLGAMRNTVQREITANTGIETRTDGRLRYGSSGGTAHRDWDGEVVINKDARGRLESNEPSERRRMIHALIHEEFHDVYLTKTGNNHALYTGYGARVEEVSTEMSARMVSQKLRIRLTLSEHGPYQPWLDQMVRDIQEATGYGAGEAWRSLGRASLKMRATTGENLQGKSFADAVDGMFQNMAQSFEDLSETQRDRLLQIMRKRNQEVISGKP